MVPFAITGGQHSSDDNVEESLVWRTHEIMISTLRPISCVSHRTEEIDDL